MFNSKSKQSRKEVEAIFNEIQINLENNYKDLAISARKKAESRIAQLKEEGALSDKDYTKLKATLDNFTKKMEGYHH